jgi:hypothetical protein
VPDDLAARLGAGWSVGLEDTMGEHQTSIWLGEDDAEAAVGWGGDRLALLDGPDGGWAIAWRTAWDTETDAAEFEDAALRVIRAGDASADVVPVPGGDEVWLIFASDDAILGQLASGLRLEAG